MGRLSNTLTLRNKNFLKTNSTNFKLSLNFLYFIKSLKRSLYNKSIYIVNHVSFFGISYFEVILYVFYRTKKIILYKKKFSRRYQTLTNPVFSFNFLGKVLDIRYKVFVLNKYLTKSKIYFFYKHFKSFKNKIFNKRHNLFFDFIQVAALFIIKKINADALNYFLGLIFAYLPKKRHSFFFFFLKLFFDLVFKKTFSSSSRIKGIKFTISGKLKGKPRASKNTIRIGSVAVQSLKEDITFSICHVYTLYGMFGFKLWISYF